ncbi:ubiquitin carboxyl-terminal hydrolase [Tribolium castaneum]|uniref:Ubiquitin carboxyl-terminal hydrolase n=1 Tax=Tribolium castaneum TaxID=7070 RepID=D2A345_TRICA|nr:PREDICTED: ubiquitin carboxyl-terminal hydrolase [Tribolium castaneum]EFA02260.2 Ubiquitin carboxyl-terminal hydrolase-like Protein [Tribolium castaneum]|eukprot:XP_015835099.1 PREDICTED: ubiquitin carboxyl-terminal hydrolase [Tribolium castaneum]
MALLPLESNPEVMNKFLHLLGVPNKWNIVDVYGLEQDDLAYITKPVLALILLCPNSEQFNKHAEEESVKLKEEGQIITPDLFFVKQSVPNVCGTIALIHSVANNSEKLGIEGPFKHLLEKTKDLTPEKRGELLFSCEDGESFNLMSVHQELAQEGQSEVNPNEPANNHFIALIEKDGHLYELNGSKEFPVNHGPTTEDTFLEDAANVCRQFISRNAEDVNFTVMALTAAEN